MVWVIVIAINLSILDFKEMRKGRSKFECKSINLSILDFKVFDYAYLIMYVITINLSILDFKALCDYLP